jgi:hypothetical protein
MRAAPAANDAPAPRLAAHDSAARAQAMNHPLVRRAVELLNARLIDVEDDPA